jgi:hypothetical protein
MFHGWSLSLYIKRFLNGPCGCSVGGPCTLDEPWVVRVGSLASPCTLDDSWEVPVNVPWVVPVPVH